MRLFHPQLGREITVPDDEACIATLTEVGWKPAPEPEAPEPGRVAEPVTYEPVKVERAAKPKSTKSS